MGRRRRMGVNISDATQDFTGAILAGRKTVETRVTQSLRPYVGRRIGIVRTGVGPATLVGWATVGEPIRYETPAALAGVTDTRYRMLSRISPDVFTLWALLPDGSSRVCRLPGLRVWWPACGTSRKR